MDIKLTCSGLPRKVVNVARAAGINSIDLPDSAIDQTITMTHEVYKEDPTGAIVPNPYRPSMLVDLDAGRPMEVEAIVGGVVRKERDLGVSTPQYAIDVMSKLLEADFCLFTFQVGYCLCIA